MESVKVGTYILQCMQSAAGKLSCNRTELKHFTDTEILWNRKCVSPIIIIITTHNTNVINEVTACAKGRRLCFYLCLFVCLLDCSKS